MSKKLNLTAFKQQAASTKERLVSKTVEWAVQNGEEVETFSGEVDIVVAGSRIWADTKRMSQSLKQIQDSGQDPDPMLIVELVRLDEGEEMDYEIAAALPGSLFAALIRAIKEVNPHLFVAEDVSKGKP